LVVVVVVVVLTSGVVVGGGNGGVGDYYQSPSLASWMGESWSDSSHGCPYRKWYY